jgi:hypothetical protein
MSDPSLLQKLASATDMELLGDVPTYTRSEWETRDFYLACRDMAQAVLYLRSQVAALKVLTGLGREATPAEYASHFLEDPNK